MTAEEYAKGVLQGDRIILGQAITIVKSNLSQDQSLAAELIEKIIQATGNSIRIGVTGVPGVGKSTFIEALGTYLTTLTKKVAVLTIDPSSQVTKGSILGDKTRMEMLSRNPAVFIRASAAGNTLGGVAAKTREAMLLCEAAGYDVIIIETVGVGQSEISVKGMVDFFLLLMLAGAGDELQGIKKGIIEMADALVITKVDGDNVERAGKAQAEYQQALQLLRTSVSGWEPVVLLSSAIARQGIDTVWNTIEEFKQKTISSGYFHANRDQQNTAALYECFATLLKADYEFFLAKQQEIHKETGSYQPMSPQMAARRLLKQFYSAIKAESSDQ